MKALAIRQPWAWAIIHAGKDIENRVWPTRFRGRFLVHAAQAMDKDATAAAVHFMAQLGVTVPDLATLPRGGFIGAVDMTDCVQVSASPWFVGPYGFVLANPRPLPFVACRGVLNFFDVPERFLPEGA